MNKDTQGAKALILSGTYKLIKEKPYRRHSFVWNTFCRVEKSDGSILQNMVCCRICYSVQKYNNRQTTNLVRHKCCRNLNSNKNTSTAPAIKDDERTISSGNEIISDIDNIIIEGNDHETVLEEEQKIPKPLEKLARFDISNETSKTDFSNVFSNWIIEDLQPLSQINKNGFKKLAKYLIDVGAQHGNNFDLDQCLPDLQSIQYDIEFKATEKRFLVKKIIHEKISECSAITYDVWPDENLKKNILSISFHYIDGDNVKEFLLGVKSMKFEQSTSSHLEKKIKSQLDEYNVELYEKIIFVSDKFNDIVSPFNNNIHINCSISLLNEVLNNAFRATKEISTMLTTCKKLLKSMKNSNNEIFLQNLKLEQQNYNVKNIFWMSQFLMLKTIYENWDFINQVFLIKDKIEELDNIKTMLLKDLIDICQHCENVFKKFQRHEVANLHYVYTSINFLRKICAHNSQNSESLEKFKENILNGIDKIWISNLNILHKVALFLFPPTNQLKLFNSEQIEEVKNYCLQQISEYFPANIEIDDNNVNNNKEKPSASVAIGTDSNIFSDTIMFSGLISNESDSNITKESQIKLEISKYSAALVDYHENFNVLKWWLDHNKEYRFLFILSQKIFCVPAACVASKKLFSKAEALIAEKQNKFYSKSVKNILFLNSLIESNI